MAGPLLAASGAHGSGKTRAAALSIASNSILIVLKLAAGAITGSVAIITEAMHSSVDLVASIVAYVSVRTADKPADTDHPYGHDKFENLAAAIEALLILVGAGVIVFESIRRLSTGAEVHALGIGIAVIAFSVLANVVVSTLLARRARETDSPALEGDAAHLRTDAATSAAVLVGLVAVQLTGAAWLDPIIALAVAAAIVYAGITLLLRASRVLVDEALPPAELDAVRAAITAFGPLGVCGYHKLRARRAGSRRYVDLHVQFVAGTTLEAAHETAHRLQDAIRERVRGADVLIHLEPEASLHPGTELTTQPPGDSGP
jgi:cation diffusion facilitator family transporter